jgi:hypothetical protein
VRDWGFTGSMGLTTSSHWALNVGINFYTPEEFFLGEAAQEMSHRFDPVNYIADKEGGGDKR